jgi:CheY-like chemotaxis protein
MRPLNRKLVDPPAEQGEAAEGEATFPQPRDKPGVLVVDDNYLVGVSVQLGLERNGFDARFACGGREAIRLYRQHRDSIAVVLLDIYMPGLDGPQTLEGLRELNPEVLVCFMSGDASAYEPEGLRPCGVACVIAKPFRLEDLANVLRLVTQGVPPACCRPAGRPPDESGAQRPPGKHSCLQSVW